MTEADRFVAVLGMALVHFLWQGAVIGATAALALRLLRDAAPQARYLVACLALAACVLAPLAGVVAALTPSPTATLPLPAGVEFTTGAWVPDASARGWLAPWLPWIVSAWAAGAGALSLRMAVGLLWIHALRRAWQPAEARAWQRRLDALAAKCSLARGVALRLVDRLDTPASAGWLRPVVLLPAAVAARMPVDLVEALLAHELAHIRRHDYLVNLLQGLAEAALFFHPVTWWLSRRIRIEREQVADQLAARAIDDPRRLAVALAQLAALQADMHPPMHARAHGVPCPHLAQAAHGGQLMSRIQSLVQPGRRATAGAFVLPFAGVVLAGLALYAHAQSPAATTPALEAPPPALQQALPASPVPRTTPAPAAVPVPAVSAGPVLPAPDARPARRFGSVESIRSDGDRETLRFEHDGRDYVIDDPATVARARAAWRDFEALTPRMEAMAAQMARHGEAMGAAQARMAAEHAARAARAADGTAIHEAAARVAALAMEQQGLALQQASLATRQSLAPDSERAAIERELAALDARMAELDARMEARDEALDAAGRALEESLAPLEALGEEMDEASRPMEALGHQMEALGHQHGVEAREATAKMLAVIEEAMARGLARPASD